MKKAEEYFLISTIMVLGAIRLGVELIFFSNKPQQVIDQLTNAIYESRSQGKGHFDLRDYFTKIKPKGTSGRGRTLEGFLKLDDNQSPLPVSIDIGLYNDRFLINNQANHIYDDSHLRRQNFKYIIDFRYYKTNGMAAFFITMPANVPNGYKRLSNFMY